MLGFLLSGVGIHYRSIEEQLQHAPPQSFASKSSVRPSPRAKSGPLHTTCEKYQGSTWDIRQSVDL